MGAVPSQMAHVNTPHSLSCALLSLHLRNILFTIKGSRDGNLVREKVTQWHESRAQCVRVGSPVITYDSLDNLIVYWYCNSI